MASLAAFEASEAELFAPEAASLAAPELLLLPLAAFEASLAAFEAVLAALLASEAASLAILLLLAAPE
ncbi:hypothetical protein [Lentilactobacillus parafarraginis]|uniref:hypothetical protein n=1 Tax=Lentilactobacillus parafarraginis TaxID=390842 RepID=UPI0006D17D93|nr:hypothetical protein [Lentilactobacillus parafarraginis]